MIKNKRSRTKLAGLAFLVFTLLLLVCEIVVAILTNSNAIPESVQAYSVTLIILPVVSLVSTLTIVLTFYNTSKKSQTLVDSLERVARGDFSVSLEVKKLDSFSQVYDNFNKMTRELGSVAALREGFVHDLSHEIKTPVSSIHGFASLLLEGNCTEEEQKQYLKIIADEAERLRRFVDGVLTLSKLENQQFAGESKDLRLDLQIRDCVITLQKEWEIKGVEINLSLTPVIMRANEELLRHIWLNILTNAIKYTPSGGKVDISLKRENGYAVAVFKDSGAGIAAEDLPHIFDKYYRGLNVKTVEGNGVGLAICKRICDLLEGEITCNSKKGEGATFTVKLPL